jgi:Domain of unknown function (DUF4111)/Nucleotidyltransferase domain
MGTPEEEAVVAVERLAAACVDILPSIVVAAILHGSLTLDDFRPGRSDLDLLLVVERGLTTSEAEALVDLVGGADPGPAGGIDLLVVTRATAARPADHPGRELLVGRYPGPNDDLEVEGRDDDVPDVWPELSMARATGRALVGAEPRSFMGEVPVDRVRANGTSWLRTWLERTDDDENAALMVLTACRIWRFAVDGEHSSKSAAARWALRRDPSLTAVGQALADRAGGDRVRIAPGDVERLLLRVLHDVDEIP